MGGGGGGYVKRTLNPKPLLGNSRPDFWVEGHRFGACIGCRI